jgi:hypothetical protein
MTEDMVSFKGWTEKEVQGVSLYSDRWEITPLQP